MIIPQLAWRMTTTTDPRLLWKFAYNFGFKGMLSVQRFKRRLKQGIHFPPFIYISIINSCNLRCQGCWVDVAGPRRMIPLDKLDRIVTDAQRHGNNFFGILGGEPFLHPDLMTFFGRHRGAYFQVFTNGQMITDEVAARLRQFGNVTPLISIEGSVAVSDERRGRLNVYNKTLAGLEACLRHRLITGVASSICQSNFDDLVNDRWIQQLIDWGVHYTWFHTYRPVGPDPSPELALTPQQGLDLRKFVVTTRARRPIGIVDAYYDDQGEALCPMATGVSHHIGPEGDIEPCPIIQFAKESVHEDKDLYTLMTESPYLAAFRKESAKATQGCVVLERPDLVKRIVEQFGARDTTGRSTGMVELNSMKSLPSQHQPGHAVPEEHWMYRFAKKHWFFGFGAYT